MSKSAHALVFCRLFSYTISLVSLGEHFSFSFSMVFRRFVLCREIQMPYSGYKNLSNFRDNVIYAIAKSPLFYISIKIYICFYLLLFGNSST